MKAARELGVEQYVSASPYLDGESNTVAVVTYMGRAKTKGIAPYSFIDPDLVELKRTLLWMLEEAKELARGVMAV
jgi:hypothetical protein